MMRRRTIADTYSLIITTARIAARITDTSCQANWLIAIDKQSYLMSWSAPKLPCILSKLLLSWPVFRQIFLLRVARQLLLLLPPKA